MQAYLVDVPVKINIWTRPQCQKKQWEIIKKAKPSILFIQSDGGRNEKEWEAIYENRKMIDESIDWDCKVYRIYEDHNNGMYAMGAKVSKLIWSKVDRCIFTEDDQVMSVSFFRYCAELLEKYKDDLRIECICGVNHLGKCEDVKADYFFSRQGSIWGFATWKRIFEERNNFSYGKDAYVMKLLKSRTKHNKIAYRRLVAYSRGEMFEGHVPASEFWHEFAMYGYNRLQIIPKVNLVSNIGNLTESEHANSANYLPKAYNKIFGVKTYEMDFPLKTTEYVIPDVNYEKKRNRIMAYNHPFISAYRKFVQVFKMICHGDFSKLKSKILSKGKNEK